MQLCHPRTKSGYSHTDTDRDIHAHTQFYTDFHFNADQDIYADVNPDIHQDTHPDLHFHADPYTHTNVYSNIHPYA